jgi:excisionase family DNA binding protein
MLLTKKEFATRIGYSVRTLDRMIRSGFVQAVHYPPGAHPRIPESELNRFKPEVIIKSQPELPEPREIQRRICELAKKYNS